MTLPTPYIIRYAVCAAAAAGVALLAIPYALRWAHRYGIIDEPGGRRIHKGRVARAGGIVFFPTLMVCMAAAAMIWPVLWDPHYLGLAVAGAFLTVTGLIDDIFDMRAALKLACQLGTGAILFAFGYRFSALSLPFVGRIIELGPADLIVTMLAVTALINAINMLDGLDGLAAGSVLIMCGFLFINKMTSSLPSSGLLLAITIGMTLGFLWYNFHPARLFMGDTGSMLLGLILAVELLDSASQGAAVTTVLLPLVILGIPLFDMCRTVFFRARASRHIFKADKTHLHHRLLDFGLSHRAAVVFLYLMNIYMGAMSLIYKHVDKPYRGLFLLCMALFLFLASYLIGMTPAARTRENRDG